MLESQTAKKLSRVLDLTEEQADVPQFTPPKHRILYDRKQKRSVVFRRDPKTIDGIVLHQTATPYSVSPDQVKAAKGNAILAKHRRALNIAAHLTAFDTGYAVHANPLDWYVYHANSLCARSLGMEIEGKFPGTQGDKELLTGGLLEAAREGLEYLVSAGRAAGMPIKYVWAHRQSSMTRPDDPGEEIWRKLVVEYAAPLLGLIVQPHFVTGGESLPETWLKVRST